MSKAKEKEKEKEKEKGPWQDFVRALGTTKQVYLIGPRTGHEFSPPGPAVYVDGGTKFMPAGRREEFHPTIAVGDGDSFTGSLDVELPKAKDYSDLAYVLRRLPPTVRHIELIGFLGGRRDHELLNYGEVHHFLKERSKLTTVRLDNRVVAFSGGHINIPIKSTFSVVTFEQSLITITGDCKYPVAKAIMLLPVSSEGLSNEGFGQVTIDCLNPCFVFIN